MNEELVKYFEELHGDGFMVFRHAKDGRIWATDTRIAFLVPVDFVGVNYYVDEIKTPKKWDEKNDCRVLTAQALAKALSECPQEDDIEVKDLGKCTDCNGTGVVRWQYTDKTGKIHHKVHECPVCNGYGETSEMVKLATTHAIDGSIIDVSPCLFSAYNLKKVQRFMGIIGCTELRIKHSDKKVEIFDAGKGIEVAIASWVDYDGPRVKATLLPF